MFATLVAGALLPPLATTPAATHVPDPLVSTSGVVAARPGTPMSAPPLLPAAPGWMWARMTFVFAGKLFIEMEKSTVLVSLWIVTTAVPRPTDSALPTGGFSFAGGNCTVNTLKVLGLVGVELPHPAAPIASKLTVIARRFIGVLLVSQ